VKRRPASPKRGIQYGIFAISCGSWMLAMIFSCHRTPAPMRRRHRRPILTVRALEHDVRTVAREVLTTNGRVTQRELRAELHIRFGRVGRSDRRQAICREETAIFESRGKVARFDKRDALVDLRKPTLRRLTQW
jgi:hypothetical protein